MDENDVPHATMTLDSNRSKSRFGVAYVRAICSQAGIGFQETSPDEDVLAIDGNIQYEPVDTRIQIKCSSRFNIKGKSASVPIESKWLKKWHRCKMPVYLVLVMLGQEDQQRWLDHEDSFTLYNAIAFWARVDQLPLDTTSVHIPKSQRLTVATIEQWGRELDLLLSPQEAAS